MHIVQSFIIFIPFSTLFLSSRNCWQTIQSKINVLSDSNQYKVQQNELNRETEQDRSKRRQNNRMEENIYRRMRIEMKIIESSIPIYLRT